jgi:hypothetical protein
MELWDNLEKIDGTFMRGSMRLKLDEEIRSK